MRATESLALTAKKLERFVYDPMISQNPYHKPVELRHGEDVELIPYEAIRLINNTDATLQIGLDALAEIVGKPITLIISPATEIKNMRRRSSRTLDRRPDKPITGTNQEGIPYVSTEHG